MRSFLDLLTKHYRENPAWADPCSAYGDCVERELSAVTQFPRTPMRSRSAAVG